jgi:hypothetical protein
MFETESFGCGWLNLNRFPDADETMETIGQQHCLQSRPDSLISRHNHSCQHRDFYLVFGRTSNFRSRGVKQVSASKNFFVLLKRALPNIELREVDVETLVVVHIFTLAK